ncbi:MAG: hypothetical protein R2806_21195 [Saprospiraceae bacterium]
MKWIAGKQLPKIRYGCCFFVAGIVLLSFSGERCVDADPITASPNDLHFDALPEVWDEGIPLGNGMIGALIWKKDGMLRLSLDRADLWDLRPMPNLKLPEWKFQWVYEQWKADNYKPVQEKFDVPYDQLPAPSKIPGAALEFDITTLGEVEYVHLYLQEALCVIQWKSGVRFLTYVDATKPVGRYQWEGLTGELPVAMVPPTYVQEGIAGADNPVTGQDLRRLEYRAGRMDKDESGVTYTQEGWGGFEYQVYASNTYTENRMDGIWSISSSFPGAGKAPSAKQVVDTQRIFGFSESLVPHLRWWKTYWNKSKLQVPDSILQKQWMLEVYKFGSVARPGAPPISLQAVWTADNGKLPPWKGDFHHDLNTQLSYWPAYSGNHLDEEIGYLDWLWKYRATFRKYTQDYFGVEGLNVPGVTTLTGEPMGGWIQYAFGPTVSAWLGQHFYLHWRYSMDRQFLELRAYPWIRDVAVFLEAISEVKANGERQLPISSSPEIHDNSREAWFGETTNYDLALIRWTFEKAAELALELGKNEESRHWQALLKTWPSFAIDEMTGLKFAPQLPYQESHRHFSHLMAFHPLGLIDLSKGQVDREIIQHTLANLEAAGTSGWCGYSFSWLANLKARARDGEGAAEALRIFATSFCLPNSFHVNGDQSGKGYSNFTYRPFTLEGNFAFAAGLQEMLIQSHTGVVHLFPAIPEEWKEVRFTTLRTEGAFLVSASMDKGKVISVSVTSEMGGVLKLKNPFGSELFECSNNYQLTGENILNVQMNRGQTVTFNVK